jgi:hypothetical protein
MTALLMAIGISINTEEPSNKKLILMTLGN